ncbi:hypothetical protein BGY98DRAFT_1001199 [Russula aff. rugulosa BPL654]|nr:hypothetical protein BGY98DRAFT_1001199 [Russula aff. rugulosa BPL654]
MLARTMTLDLRHDIRVPHLDTHFSSRSSRPRVCAHEETRVFDSSSSSTNAKTHTPHTATQDGRIQWGQHAHQVQSTCQHRHTLVKHEIRTLAIPRVPRHA